MKRKKEKRKMPGVGSELKVPVNAGLERLKVLCGWKDGYWKRVPVSRSHKDKQVGEYVSK